MEQFSPRVLVTGGGLGIGYSTVEFLLRKYNARVVVFTLDYGTELVALQEEFSSSKRLFICKGDVTKVLKFPGFEPIPYLIINLDNSRLKIPSEQ